MYQTCTCQKKLNLYYTQISDGICNVNRAEVIPNNSFHWLTGAITYNITSIFHLKTNSFHFNLLHAQSCVITVSGTQCCWLTVQFMLVADDSFYFKDGNPFLKVKVKNLYFLLIWPKWLSEFHRNLRKVNKKPWSDW